MILILVRKPIKAYFIYSSSILLTTDLEKSRKSKCLTQPFFYILFHGCLPKKC